MAGRYPFFKFGRLGWGNSAIFHWCSQTREWYTQLKFLHRADYTPQGLSRIYPTQSSCCPKCLTDVMTFIHVVCLCPFVQKFWRAVVSEINIVGDLTIHLDPGILLLGIYDIASHPAINSCLYFTIPFMTERPFWPSGNRHFIFTLW